MTFSRFWIFCAPLSAFLAFSDVTVVTSHNMQHMARATFSPCHSPSPEADHSGPGNVRASLLASVRPRSRIQRDSDRFLKNQIVQRKWQELHKLFSVAIVSTFNQFSFVVAVLDCIILSVIGKASKNKHFESSQKLRKDGIGIWKNFIGNMLSNYIL